MLVGWPVTLGVAVSSAAPLTYRWQKDGVDIPGATAPTFQIPAAALVDAGSYKVVATNSSGSVASSPAIVAVMPLPVLTCRFRLDLRYRAINRSYGVERCPDHRQSGRRHRGRHSFVNRHGATLLSSQNPAGAAVIRLASLWLP
ncbi:MAG: hypothetical protein V4710_13030 [Verrucomicrobiota bacterium]